MENTTPKLGIIESDPWLEPYSAAIEGRHQHALDKELELTGGKGTLSDFATGYLYFGLHRTRRGWVFRMGSECEGNLSYRRFQRLERTWRL